MQDPSAPSEGLNWQEWLEGLDLDQPLWERIEDPVWLEGVTFSPDELTYLEELGREYAQELTEQNRLPETPPMDIPETLLAPERDHDRNLDH